MGEVATAQATAVLCWCGADDRLEDQVRSHADGRVPVLCVKTAGNFREVFTEFKPQRVILAGSPTSEAVRLLRSVRQHAPHVAVFVALRESVLEDVRFFLRRGATDVLLPDELYKAFEGGDAGRCAVPDPGGSPVPGPAAVPELVCTHEKMRKVAGIARRIAPTDATVLIEGESGTGKELVAELIHRLSRRSSQAFVTVNCGAIPEPLLESQLFGHERGSFTGAVRQQKGLFESADNGTIFLDEIGELSLEMQVKLLRFLQNREFRRIGGNRVLKVDVRLIAATNRDLKAEVKRGRFRTDLFYRLNVITLLLPPLRERPEEIPLLVEHFVRKLSLEQKIPKRRFSQEALNRLCTFRWPGNVRELQNAVERLLLLAPGEEITEHEVLEYLDLDREEGVQKKDEEGICPQDPSGRYLTLPELERLHIEKVLNAFRWNKMRTARALGINVKTLYNKIKAYKLCPPQR